MPAPARRSDRLVLVVELEERLLEAGRLDRQVARSRRPAIAARNGPTSPSSRHVSRPSGHVARPLTPGTPRATAARPSTRISTFRLRRASSAATSSSATSRPCRTIATRSQTRSTSDRTCDEKKIVRPAARSSSRIVVERPLHERVEALGRLVEDGQLRVVLERLDDADLLAHAARVVADRPAQRRVVELEPVEQLGAAGRRPARTARPSSSSSRSPVSVVPERDAARQVARLAADLDRVAVDVEAEDRRAAGRRVEEAEQQPDRRRLAGAVRARGTRRSRPRSTAIVEVGQGRRRLRGRDRSGRSRASR